MGKEKVPENRGAQSMKKSEKWRNSDEFREEFEERQKVSVNVLECSFRTSGSSGMFFSHFSKFSKFLDDVTQADDVREG